jgi:hypothetical protein
VTNNQQAEFGMAPATEECKMQHVCFFREVGMQISLITMSHPSLRTVAPPPCLPLDIKDLLKEDTGFLMGKLMEGFLMGIFDWLLLKLLCLYQNSCLH